ncbi:TRAP transporter substrate-binding protein [Sulfitobacter sp. PS-8MA]|uniref:TRAP transporter substrate-binding protein n=1 Tax=Sulfitobacter sp. PS-8MA TaxID=3237707 RepID=UPI0034C62CFF
MKRRDFLRTASAGLASPMIFGLTAQQAAAQQSTLRLHQFQPPVATIAAKVLKPWTENVAAASDGNLKIQQFDSMALGGRPPELLDQARDGAVDIAMTVVGYTPGRFPRSEAFELPFMMNGVVETCLAFQQMIEDELQEGEFKDVKILSGFVHGPGVIHSSKPVAKLEDMKNRKLRAPTRVINAMVDKLGATAVGMPLPSIPEALTKGVIDGTVLPWETTPSIRLSELVTNHTEFAGNEALYTATVVVAMNKAKYNSLPGELKAVLDAESGAKLSALGGREMAAADGPGRAIAEARGNSITTIEGPELARWKEAAHTVVADWIAEMDAKGIDGAALVEKAKALIAAKSA